GPPEAASATGSRETDSILDETTRRPWRVLLRKKNVLPSGEKRVFRITASPIPRAGRLKMTPAMSPAPLPGCAVTSMTRTVRGRVAELMTTASFELSGDQARSRMLAG